MIHLAPLLLTTTLLILSLAPSLALPAPSPAAATPCVDTLLPVSQDVCSGLGFNAPPSPDGSSCLLLDVFESSVDSSLACSTALIKPPLTLAPNGQPLPLSIPDRRPLPKTLKRDAMLKAEGANYYYLFRIVWNLYLWAPCPVLPGYAAVQAPVPDGWTLLQTLNLTQPDLPGGAEAMPLLFAMRKGDTLGFFIRGTQSAFEWSVDFTYQHANATSSNTTSPYPFPGNTHSGFTKLANDLWEGGVRQLLDQQLSLPLASLPGTVLVAGHSLGAGVGALLAYMIQEHIYSKHFFVPPKVDAYLFSAINVGDSGFTRAFDKTVNARGITFAYDIIPQMPCAPAMIACNSSIVDTTQGNSVSSWSYRSVGGSIRLTTQNIPLQRSVWNKLSSVSLCNFEAFQDATHICSYMCAFSLTTSESGENCLLHKAKGSELSRGTYCVTDTATFPLANSYP